MPRGMSNKNYSLRQKSYEPIFLGMTLKEYIAATGVTQKWLARQVPCGVDSMSLYVNGRRIPGTHRQLRLEEITKGKVRMGHDWINGKSRRESR